MKNREGIEATLMKYFYLIGWIFLLSLALYSFAGVTRVWIPYLPLFCGIIFLVISEILFDKYEKLSRDARKLKWFFVLTFPIWLRWFIGLVGDIRDLSYYLKEIYRSYVYVSIDLFYPFGIIWSIMIVLTVYKQRKYKRNIEEGKVRQSRKISLQCQKLYNSNFISSCNGIWASILRISV